MEAEKFPGLVFLGFGNAVAFDVTCVWCSEAPRVSVATSSVYKSVHPSPIMCEVWSELIDRVKLGEDIEVVVYYNIDTAELGWCLI
mmetsp:Transcript_104/g.195  ORF Transcript_104/g.195 Transcript_104/m.195 type:complete len:86 (+) Transcript_104:270-527(+)